MDGEQLRRCKMKVTRQADLAQKLGVIGEKAGKATFVEVCSARGADLLDRNCQDGVIKTSSEPQGS